MASDEKKKASTENITGRSTKRQKVSTKINLPLAPKDPIVPSTKITRSRLDFSTGMAKQLLLKQVEKGSNHNIALSPISIDVVLTMEATGSRGRTLEGMVALVGAQDIHEIKSSAKAMMAAAAGRSDEGGDGLVLCSVDGAWVDKRCPLVDSYKEEVLKGIYNCDAQTIDFKEQANKAIKEVNSWAKEASKGLITNLLQPESLPPNTTIVLANGLYFKGIWTSAHRFDVTQTQNKTFYLLTGDTVSTPFMTSRKKYHYKSFEDFKVLKIPYESSKPDKKFSMYFFLPHEKDGLQNLLKELCSDSGFSKQDCFDLREVRLAEFWIPKFKFEYEFDIAKAVKKMGMTFPLIDNPKDFSEMIKIPKGIPAVAASMFQKVVIKVDEKGTKAAAVKRATFRLLCYKQPPKPKSSFVADHPFLFMIKEEMSGLVFFMGAVLNPRL